MRAVTKVMESANREAFDVDRVKYEEEIASLHRIIDGGGTHYPPPSSVPALTLLCRGTR